MNRFQIIPRQNIDEHIWDDLNRITGGSALSTHGWLKHATTLGMIDDSFGIYENGILKAIVPVWVAKIGNFRRGTSIPFGFGNLSAFSIDMWDFLKVSLSKKLDVLTINSAIRISAPIDCHLKTFTEVVVDLEESPLIFRASLSARVQKYIRAAARDNSLLVREILNEEEVIKCWNLYQISMKYAGSAGSLTRDLFISLFRSRIDSVIYVAIQDSEIVSFLIISYKDSEAFAIATGVNRVTAKNSLAPYLMSESCDRLRSLGVNRIHFWGGLDGAEDGILEFKRKFGRDAIYYQNVVSFSAKGRFFLKLELFLPRNLARKIWKNYLSIRRISKSV